MPNPRQKRKLRSSTPKARRKPKSKKRILANPIIAANWEKSQTLAQNYRRLGLTARLNKCTGGVEKTGKDIDRLREEEENGGGGKKEDGLRISGGSRKGAEKMEVEEARIERDGETGRILRVLDRPEDYSRPNPLRDLLNEMDSGSEGVRDEEMFDQHGRDFQHPDSHAAKTAVVKKLEQEAQRPEKKYTRKQSEGERAFIEALVKKYGDDYGRMARDMKINYMQRSAGDLKRRVKKWRESGGGAIE